jgi:CHAT domain-containing protein
VAAAFGVDALLDDQVTERALKGALGSARCVHIAAHGRHDADAPSFQCLYVAPDEDSDGRLNAHELLALDMRGTEILTLSACETALGRVDLADNPRGLPATFLLSGVPTIVGTLWPVETNASAHFFGSFYEALHAGAPRLDAFVAAQRGTRARFPVYRDWGPFYLLGDWFEPERSAI